MTEALGAFASQGSTGAAVGGWQDFGSLLILGCKPSNSLEIPLLTGVQSTNHPFPAKYLPLVSLPKRNWTSLMSGARAEEPPIFDSVHLLMQHSSTSFKLITFRKPFHFWGFLKQPATFREFHSSEDSAYHHMKVCQCCFSSCMQVRRGLCWNCGTASKLVGNCRHCSNYFQKCAIL